MPPRRPGSRPPDVALLAEGVGRNIERLKTVKVAHVALLAEGVGRNRCVDGLVRCQCGSPSSRRAWVEIPTPQRKPRPLTVALLTEGVGRNHWWMEDGVLPGQVALLTEGVGRNRAGRAKKMKLEGRPPHGGRG